MQRLFIGIFVPKDLKDKIIFLQNKIKSLYSGCKLVEPENLHISLSFLGNTPDEEILNIQEKLGVVCKNYKKFDVNVSELKIIPSEKYIRVLALDLQSDGILESLSKEIKKNVGGDVKPPHLTLCRISSPVDDKEKFVSDLKRIDWTVGNFATTSVSLIKSVVTRSGPIYTSLHDYIL